MRCVQGQRKEKSQAANQERTLVTDGESLWTLASSCRTLPTLSHRKHTVGAAGEPSDFSTPHCTCLFPNLTRRLLQIRLLDFKMTKLEFHYICNIDEPANSSVHGTSIVQAWFYLHKYSVKVWNILLPLYLLYGDFYNKKTWSWKILFLSQVI